MLMEGRFVALAVIDRLQSQILEEPDELFHNASGFTEVLRATPRAFTKTTLHILSKDQVLINLNEELASLT